uniref:Uncharacterized protein n=1 Tax=Arundo donax TaxID=35708 RepID=A0A0A9A9S4_ARUDO
MRETMWIVVMYPNFQMQKQILFMRAIPSMVRKKVMTLSSSLIWCWTGYSSIRWFMQIGAVYIIVL